MAQQIAILSPILMGTDGKEKMSKSLNNYIAVFDTPADKYGKTMSIPDELIINYFNYATKLNPDEIEAIEKQLKSGEVNPKIIKQRLAREIVTMYHGAEEAVKAEEAFNLIFSKKEIPDDMPIYKLPSKQAITDVLVDAGLCKTKGEVKRLIKQNAISIENEKIKDIFFEIEDEAIIKVGKRRFLKIVK